MVAIEACAQAPADTRERAPGRAFDADDTIVACFAACLRGAPNAIAVVEDETKLSYGELDVRANKLARYLERRGASKGAVVALVSGRSAQAIVALLAILKTGAAYAPMDPTYPCEQIRYMLRDCAPAVVLTQANSPRDIATTAPVIGLDDAIARSERESPLTLQDVCTAEDPAYVLYTSGSTGQPKGVIVPHRAVVRLVIDQTYVRFGPDEVFLHAAPLAFDASTFEIWGALLHAAKLAIVEPLRPSLQQMAAVINRHGVTTAWFTAGLFHILVEQRLDALRPLRQIIAGGDVVSPSHVARARQALPDCRLVNGYGPTENTTFTTCHEVAGDGWGGGSVPIGMAINHTYVRVLDEQMLPVAIGEVGQLCAGGAGLAIGYLNAPDATREKFVPDPAAPGARLYLTGDLARQRPDGTLEFLGRADRQVKIDGKRVELGQIEEALRANTGVADALVVYRDTGDGRRKLVGYVTPSLRESNRARIARDARARLRRVLPAHMAPAEIMTIYEFPLTANGKIDHARLPAPQVETCAPGAEATQLERQLAEIFAATLHVPAVGLDRNFFDLGATSLQLIEAHAAIEAKLGPLRLVALFEMPNIRALAAQMNGRTEPSAREQAQERAHQQRGALKSARRLRSGQ